MAPRVDGVEYTPEAVEAARETLVEIRNEVLVEGDMETAVFMSHVIAYMADYKEMLSDVRTVP